MSEREHNENLWSIFTHAESEQLLDPEFRKAHGLPAEGPPPELKWTASSDKYESAMRATALNLLKCPEKRDGKAKYWVGKAKIKPTYVKCQERMPTLDTESEDEENSEDAYSSSEEDEDGNGGEEDSEEE